MRSLLFMAQLPSTADDLKNDALKKIEDRLNCIICQEIYTHPKILQCNHVFCKHCLEKVGISGSRYNTYLQCPTCRENTPISGVGDLRDAFRTSQILDIVSEHKKIKLDKDYCPQHPNRELELYCEECKDRICFQCTLQQHHGHKYNLISETLKPAEDQLMLIKDTLKTFATISEEINGQKAAIKTEMEKSSKELRDIIENRESKIISKLDAVTQEKLHELSSQRKQVEATQEKLKQRLELLQKDIRDGEKSLVDEVTKITTEIGPEIIEPSTEADMKFSSSDVASEACNVHGFISAPTVPEPSQCHTISEVPTVTTVGEKSTTLIQVNTHEGTPLEKSIQSLEYMLVSELTGDSARGSAERNGPSQYEVSYQPTIKGRHQLHIKVMDEHIKGSPYSVIAKSSVDKLGTVMKSISLPNNHLGITINLSGDVVMVKCRGHNISIHPYGDTATHSTQASVAMPGNEQDTPSRPPSAVSVQSSFSIQPSGVTIDGEGNIYVANSKRQKHKVQKFTPQGKFLAEGLTLACSPGHSTPK